VAVLVALNASMKRIQAEADKCIVLCSNCHRKRHYNESENRSVLAKEA